MKKYTLQVYNIPILKTNSLFNAVYRINSLPIKQRKNCQLLDNYTGEVLYHYQYTSQELIKQYKEQYIVIECR